MNKDDVVTVYIAFSDGTGGKRRPVLVLKDESTKLLLYRITSKYKNKSKRIQHQYYPLLDWQAAGCNKPSYIDIGDLASIDKSFLGEIKQLGRLSIRDIQGLKQFITQYQLNQSE
jgi:PemK-like protein.